MKTISLALIILGSAGVAPITTPGTSPESRAVASDSADRARALHLLNRITYGPRPGDVDRVLAMGIDRFIDQQLHPERIDDPRAETAARSFPVLTMSMRDLAEMDAEVRRARQQQQRQMSDTGRMAGDMPPPAEGARLRQLVSGFQQAAVVRATVSERQLYEVMVDFWTNHFNVFLQKGQNRVYTPSYIEETIRPRALGKFEDLLVATAKSPAMLFYLDNFQSVVPGAQPPPPPFARGRGGFRGGRPPQFGLRGGRGRQMGDSMAPPPPQMPQGINENYARELMELHTLGVDGGYTQQDVVNVARILTGWSITRRDQNPGFEFRDWAHDRGEKVVLGRKFPAGNDMSEGQELLHFLATQPATMHHVSAKICARLVHDSAPDGCIDAAVRAWKRTDGDIREVVRAVIRSDDFWAPQNRAAKIKTPLEFVVSAVRAVGGEPDTMPNLSQLVGRLGQPLYLQQPPTGYPETQESWVNAGALLQRFNIATALASGRLPGARVNLDSIVPRTDDLDSLVNTVNRVVMNGTASAHTLQVFKNQASRTPDADAARALVVGLALGSPEFQKQ